MTVKIGIIAEFNPLHSGHEYLIKNAQKYLEKNGGGQIICVMSEYFTQRGEVAIISGQERAEEAVRKGIDLVLALPYVASVAYSDDFAKKSIEILAKAGITHLIFGVEKGKVERFSTIYEKEQDENYQEEYKKLLKQGYSHAKINSLLLELPADEPNFLLAYSYYKALQQTAPHIKLIPVERVGQSLNAKTLEKRSHLSATAIRHNIENSEIANYLSKEMYSVLQTKNILTEQDFYPYIKYQINVLGKTGLKEIYDINEGLENRIYEANQKATTYKQLVEEIATKRYSNKKIQRVLLHILTGLTKADYEKSKNIQAVRVLAVKKEQTTLIKEINSADKIKLITNLNSKTNTYFEHDIKVSRIYNSLSGEKDIYKQHTIISRSDS